MAFRWSTRSRGKRIALGALAALLLAVAVAWLLRSPRPAQLTPEDRATLGARTLVINGETYGILRGDAYKRLSGSDDWTYVAHLFDPDYKEVNLSLIHISEPTRPY